MTKLTALDKMVEHEKISVHQANLARDEKKENPEDVRKAYRSGYTDGRAAAFKEAQKIFKAELKRLQNLHQNGSLIATDFE